MVEAGVDRVDRVDRVVVLRRTVLAVYFAFFFYTCVTDGVPIGKDRVILWTMGALACASIGKPLRQIGQLLLDWIPFALVLVAYDYSRGAADGLGMTVHYTPQIDADKLLFFGHVPTEWLQEHLFHTYLTSRGAVATRGPVQWYEVVFDLVYVSHYLASFIVAGVLWAKNRARFVAFARRFVTLSFAGFLTYALFPAAAPWDAARHGDISPLVGRIGGRGLREIAVGDWSLGFVRDLVDKGAAVSNLVAAVPSLHAGYATLIAITLWRSVPRWARPLLAMYPVLMGLSLVATGEHYVIDIILGVLYAFGVHLLWNRIEHYLAARKELRQSAPPAFSGSPPHTSV